MTSVSTAAEPLFKRMPVGADISKFNSLKITDTVLKRQHVKVQRSSFGVNELPSASKNQFFKMKRKGNWQSGLVETKGNVIQKIALLNKSADKNAIGTIFRTVKNTLGPDFTIHEFRSFRQVGIAFDWKSGDLTYSLGLVEKKNGKWFAHLDVRSGSAATKPEIEASSPKVASLMEGILGPSGMDSFASDGMKEDDLSQFIP